MSVSLPTDIAGLLAWHEGNSQSELAGDPVATAVGVGGTPNSQTQATAGKRPTIFVHPITGHKALRFDAVDDSILLAASTALTARPLTVFAMYAPRGANNGRRMLTGDSSAHNWLMGPRGEVSGHIAAYVGGFLDSGFTPTIGVPVLHVLRQPSSGNAVQRVNGLDAGESSSTNVPGVITMGVTSTASWTEPAEADLYALAVYNTYVADADVAALELNYFNGFFAEHRNKFTQAVGEVLEAGGKVRVSQAAGELLESGGKVRVSQAAGELRYDAGNVRMSQAVGELRYDAGTVRISQAVGEVYYTFHPGSIKVHVFSS